MAENQDPLDLMVQKVVDLRGEIESSVKELAKLSEELRVEARKTAYSDLTSRYLAFATAHMRLANATSSELHRTARTETRIAQARLVQEEEARLEAKRAEARAKRKAKPEVSVNLPPVDTSFEEVYGEVIDAE